MAALSSTRWNRYSPVLRIETHEPYANYFPLPSSRATPTTRITSFYLNLLFAVLSCP